MILEGWHHAVLSGRYAGVRYDCASESVARWISRLARNVFPYGRSYLVGVQMSAEEIAALSPDAQEDDRPGDDQQPGCDTDPPGPETARTMTVCAPAPAKPASTHREIPEVRFSPQEETAENVEARERRYREIFGPPESKGRRRWRR
jgi:hypothetical protein